MDLCTEIERFSPRARACGCNRQPNPRRLSLLSVVLADSWPLPVSSHCLNVLYRMLSLNTNSRKNLFCVTHEASYLLFILSTQRISFVKFVLSIPQASKASAGRFIIRRCCVGPNPIVKPASPATFV